MDHRGRLPAALLLSCVWASPARAQLAPAEQRLVATIDARREDAIALLARTVDVPSATENHEGVRAVAAIYAAELAPLGFETRWVEQGEVGRAGHLVAEHRGTRGKRILLIGHLDTVLQGERVPPRRRARLRQRHLGHEGREPGRGRGAAGAARGGRAAGPPADRGLHGRRGGHRTALREQPRGAARGGGTQRRRARVRGLRAGHGRRRPARVQLVAARGEPGRRATRRRSSARSGAAARSSRRRASSRPSTRP